MSDFLSDHIKIITVELPKPKPKVFCPECGNTLVWDSGVYHCDKPDGTEGCGAFDPEYVIREDQS